MSDSIVDLVIIGGGPAGMAAGCEARALNLSVLLLDEQAKLGGQIYRAIESASSERIAVLGADYGAGQKLATDFRVSGARHLGGASVWNVAADGRVDYVVDGKAGHALGRHVLFASGAMERPFPIEGWTLPGVMGAGAVQILFKASGALPSTPVVLAGCGPLLYLLASQLLRAGVQIRAVVDTTSTSDYFRAAPRVIGALRGWRDLAKGISLLSAPRHHRVPVFSGATNLSIGGTKEVEALKFEHRGRPVSLPTSLVLLHQGVVPNTQLTWAAGFEHHWNPEQLCWQPVTDRYGRLGDSRLFVAGDSRAIVGAQASAVQGRLAALSVGERLGVVKDLKRRAAPLWREFQRHAHIRPFLDSLYRPKVENRIPKKAAVLVCRCEEVTASQVRDYVALGCLGPNQAKAFGRCGMGPCQGRLCGLTVTELIADARGVLPEEVGYYRIRPPIKPVLLGAFLDQKCAR